MKSLDLAHALQQKMYVDIPLTQHMGVVVEKYLSKTLTLTAPLSKNINHRETAFGGSVASLATLTCWGLIYLELKQLNIHARTVIQSASTEYIKPITSDFLATCSIEKEETFEKFLKTLERKKRARIELSSTLFCESELVAKFVGRFVAQKTH